MREENLPMPFSVKAYIDDHTLTADADTAKDAFAIAVEWHVAERLTGISISDGIKKYSIAEFSSVLADLLLAVPMRIAHDPRRPDVIIGRIVHVSMDPHGRLVSLDQLRLVRKE